MYCKTIKCKSIAITKLHHHIHTKSFSGLKGGIIGLSMNKSPNMARFEQNVTIHVVHHLYEIFASFKIDNK